MVTVWVACICPTNLAKARSLREEGKPILEMGVQDARRLTQVLLDTTVVRLASELAERDLIDGVGWTGSSEAVRGIGGDALPLVAGRRY